MKRYIRGGFTVRGKYIRASYDVPDEPATCEEKGDKVRRSYQDK